MWSQSNPDLLFITMDRSAPGQKVELPVEINHNINVNNEQYQLKGFIKHDGEELTSGHYFAFSLLEDGVWVFDDNGLTTQCPDFEKIPNDAGETIRKYRNRASILFYEKVGPESTTALRTAEVPALSTPDTSQGSLPRKDVTPTPEKSASLKGRLLARHAEEDSVKFVDGSVKDVIFVGKNQIRSCFNSCKEKKM